MSKFMTAARKITAARLTGAAAGAGIMTALTKDLTTVLPVAGIAVVGIAVLHRRMKDLPADEKVTMSDLASEAGRSAGEVAFLAAATTVAKRGVTSLFSSKAAPVVEVAPLEVDVVDLAPSV